MSHGWIGVDLDGTLAEYHGWNGGAIGRPIPRMVERVKQWLSEGKDVRIFTARACELVRSVRGVQPELNHEQVARIQDWCLEHIGRRLRVQYWKDARMIELWDDRVKQVLPNTGVEVALPVV